jgi:hypothetical protein
MLSLLIFLLVAKGSVDAAADGPLLRKGLLLLATGIVELRAGCAGIEGPRVDVWSCWFSGMVVD